MKRGGRGILVLLCVLLVALPGVASISGQTRGGVAPSFDLFLVPSDIVSSLEGAGVTVHDYGESALMYLPNADSLSPAVLARLSHVEGVGTISYRSWSGSYSPSLSADPSTLPDGYYLVGLVGPLDASWLAAWQQLGLVIVDSAPPYSVLVHGDGARLQRALQSVTSGGFRVIRSVLALPAETRLDPRLAGLAHGDVDPASFEWLRRTADGRALIRVLPFDDQQAEAFAAAVTRFAQPADAPESYGHPFTFAAVGPEITSILTGVQGVALIEPVPQRELHNNLAAKNYILNVTPMWDLGWNGAGVIVDHNDGGVNLTHPDFPSGVILATNGAMSGTDNEHGTHTAGSVLGRGLAASSPTNTSGCGDQTTPLSTVRGMAHGAQLVTNNLFDGGLTTETTMLRWGYQQGGRISTNSWGYISTYTYNSASVSVDTAVRDADSTTAGNQQLAVLFSAGNDGSGASTIGTPGTAKNALTVGASQNDRCGSYVPSQQAGPNINTVVTFSGRGPAQGRIKPDVVAVGADVLSVDSLNCVGSTCEEGWDQSWTGTYYRLMPGTSMSTPITAGATAVFSQFYNTTFGSFPSPALIKAAMINGAVDMGLGYPSFNQGWGRINLGNSVQGPTGGHVNFVDQGQVTPLATGATWSKSFSVFSNAARLKVTLVWTDPPGTAGCTSGCLRNDLNLVVTDSNGTVYRGNQLTSSWSTPNPGSATDTVNNVENVFVAAPATGQWTIQVTSANTVQNPPGLTGQDFAVVYSGDCADCTPLGAPTGLTAAPSGNNAIALSWGTVSGATQYRVYRSTTSGTGYALVGTATPPTTTYTDSTASGGVTYYYVVRSFGSGSSACESANSNEASATAGGTCLLPPSFAGVQTVSASNDQTCSLDLAWTAATRQCTGTGSITYTVYRSTSSPFTPSASTRIVSGLTATSYTDSNGLSSPNTYYYIVRAVDTASGVEDANSVTLGEIPGPRSTQNLYPASGAQTFDNWAIGSMGDWTASYYNGGGSAADWTGARSCTAHSGAQILRYGGASNCTANYANSRHAFAYPPALVVPAGSNTVRLSLWHKWQFESTYDGAYLRVSLDGATFTYVTSGALSGQSYTGTVAGIGMWTGTSTGYSGSFANTIVDLDAACNMVPANVGGCAGKTVYVAFSIWTDSSQAYDGWFLDDVQITANVPGPCSGAPNNVQFFTARSTAGANKLEWQNPAGSYGSTRICWSTSAYPADPAACGSSAVDIPGSANDYGTYTHSSVNGTKVYYTAFVDNGSGTYSSGRRVSGTPFDTPAELKWTYSTGASSLAPAGINPGALDVGSVYAVSNDRVLHGMNVTAAGGDWPRGGTFDWTPLAMNAPAQHRPGVLPLSAGKRIVLASQDGYAYCADAAAGGSHPGTVWVSNNGTLPLQLGTMLQAGPTGMYSDFVPGAVNRTLIGTRNATAANKVSALDPVDGHEVYAFTNSSAQNGDGLGIGIVTGLTVDYATSRVYFTSRGWGGGSSNTVWCVTVGASTASRVWAVNKGDIDGSPVLHNGRLYVGTNAGWVYALDPANGSEVWSYNAADGPIKGYVYPHFGSTPLKLYFSTTDKIWALQENGTSTPTKLWEVTTVPSPSTPLLLASANLLLAGGNDGRLYQLDVTSPGTTLTSRLLGTGTIGSPGLDGVNNLALAGSSAGVVYAVSVPLP